VRPALLRTVRDDVVNVICRGDNEAHVRALLLQR
jgi:hypothetical protein